MTTKAVPVRPVTPPSRLPAGMVVAAIGIAATVTAVVVAGLAVRDTMWLLEIDFKAYHVAGSAVLGGTSPYDAATLDGLQFIYPPFTALIFAPLGLMNVHVAFAVWTFASVLALAAAAWMALRLVRPETPVRRAKFAILATVVALPTAPLLMHLSVGQIGALLMLLVLADLARRPGRTQGITVGIAAGMKLIPLIFIVYFLITGRIRAAVVSSVTFVATVLVGFLLLPGASARWWGELVLDTERMTPTGSEPFNQSMRGVLGQLPGILHASWFWLMLAILVGLAGLAVSAWASRRGMEAAGIFACAVTSLLVSPISWPDHWVWVVPGLALCMWWTWQRRSSWGVTLAWLVLVAHGAVIFLVVLGAPVPSAAGVDMPVRVTFLLILNSLTLLGGLGFLAALAAVLRRREHRSISLTAPS